VIAQRGKAKQDVTSELVNIVVTSDRVVGAPFSVFGLLTKRIMEILFVMTKK
jgi:hypothetical protein